MPRAVALGGARMLGWVSLEVAGALFSVCVWEEPGELQMFLLFCLSCELFGSGLARLHHRFRLRQKKK